MSTNKENCCIVAGNSRVVAGIWRNVSGNVCNVAEKCRDVAENRRNVGKESRNVAESWHDVGGIFRVSSGNIRNVADATSTVSQILSPATNPSIIGRQVTARWTCFILYSGRVYSRPAHGRQGEQHYAGDRSQPNTFAHSAIMVRSLLVAKEFVCFQPQSLCASVLNYKHLSSARHIAEKNLKTLLPNQIYSGLLPSRATVLGSSNINSRVTCDKLLCSVTQAL